jgi:hypothetical protein
MSGKRVRLAICVAVVGVIATATAAIAGGDARDRFRANLSGYEELPATISTTGNGTFRAALSRTDDEIRWELRYDDLEAAVLQAHIHFGGPAVAGPITVFLCTNLGNGPVGTQPCPAPPAVVTGTITPADVTAGAAAVGLGAGEFDELVRAMRAGATYANVHSQLRPSGEIRGQIHRSSEDEQ